MGKKTIAFAPPLAETSLANVLFTPVQQRVLGLLFGQPARSFQSGELIRMAGFWHGGGAPPAHPPRGEGLVSSLRATTSIWIDLEWAGMEVW